MLEAFNLGGCAAANIRLHSTINILIRVELRTVGRQEKQLNAIFMSLDPLCYGLALVDTQIVDDQIDFSRLVFYQIFKKFNECFLVHGLILDLESQQPLVGSDVPARQILERVMSVLSARVTTSEPTACAASVAVHGLRVAMRKV